jgi:hypothetical protein
MPPPIDNRDNTCYIATGAQCLFAMAEHSRDVRDQLPEVLEGIRTAKSGNGSSLLAYHTAACNVSKPPYPTHFGKMGEAPHAFQVMIEPLPDVHAAVQGAFCDSYVCGGCKALVKRRKAYSAMPLSFDDRHGRVTTLPECIESYFVPESITDYACEACGIGHRCDTCGGKSKCTKCGVSMPKRDKHDNRAQCACGGVAEACGGCKATRAKNTATVSRLAPTVPEFWLMHLVRSTPISGVRVTKDTRPITCSEILEMSRTKDSDDVDVYMLVYVGHQIGSDTGGHWYAESKGRDGQWWKCDDESITPIANPSPSNGSAVMLMYHRVPVEQPKRQPDGYPTGKEKRSRSGAAA